MIPQDSVQKFRPFHKMFEDHARIAPDKIAVVCGGRKCSYREIDALSDALARELLQRAVSTEQIVGVLLPKSVDLVVAILGIAKAGAAFLLLDPAMMTGDRAALLLSRAAVSILITRSGLFAPAASGPIPLCLDRWRDPGPLRPLVRPDTAAKDLAYLVFTSGSTGTPKGVLVEHEALSNYLQWATREYLTPSGHGAPVFTSVSFDLTLTSLLLPLVGGQPIILADDDADFDEIADLLARYRKFSFIKATPTHFGLIGSAMRDGIVDVADRFVVGGERFRAGAMVPWRAGNPEALIYNEYGPTEGTIANVAWADAAGAIADSVPIGRPIERTSAFVLGADLIETRGTGELYISGACLARGYLGDPARTAEVFRPNPFGNGDRMYATGDLARLQDDGNLICLGRIDDQIKLNGYRIEPGEIEAVICRMPGVRDGAVALRESPKGRARLVAFVTREPSGAPSSADLLAHLAQELPPYMVPSEVQWVESLPTSAAGKVNRKALSDGRPTN